MLGVLGGGEKKYCYWCDFNPTQLKQLKPEWMQGQNLMYIFIGPGNSECSSVIQHWSNITVYLFKNEKSVNE